MDVLPDKKRLQLLGRLAFGDVLDVGCHDVQNPYLMNAIGFDLARPAALPVNYKDFVEGNCESLDRHFNARQFDTIVAGEIIEHLENASAFLRACHVVLKDSGRLLLTTPNPYHWLTIIGNVLLNHHGITPDHINLYPYRAMYALLQHTGWRLVEVQNASGGMRAWPGTRTLFVPCPKGLTWQLLYICEKRRNRASILSTLADNDDPES